MARTVELKKSNHIAYISLNHPERHNALGSAEFDALNSILDTLSEDAETRVVVLTAVPGKTFCAGAALDEMRSGKINGDMFQAMTDRFAALPQPTLCAINGNVFGGGVELAMSCDFRVGVAGMKLRVPAAVIGLCYPIDGIRRLVQRLGPVISKRLLLMAESLDADQLQVMGVLQQTHSATDFEEAVRTKANEMAALAPLAVRSMKAIIDHAAMHPGAGFDSAMANQLSELCLQSQDLQEGFLAAAEKRAPEFNGR